MLPPALGSSHGGLQKPDESTLPLPCSQLPSVLSGGTCGQPAPSEEQRGLREWQVEAGREGVGEDQEAKRSAGAKVQEL